MTLIDEPKVDLPTGMKANEIRYLTPYVLSPLLPLLLLSLSKQRHSPTTKKCVKKEYDYIIVGAGSAGSVVASRLSEMPCVSVLLLEAGKAPPQLTDIPAISRSFINSDIDWAYKTAPQKYTAAGHTLNELPWPSGKTLGGSSVFNSMLYVRGNRRNYDEWEKMGATGWNYESVFPYFLRLEDNEDPEFLENGFHTKGGPITAKMPPYNSEKKRALMEAVVNEGFSFVDPNAQEQIGFFNYQATMHKGQRCSTAKAYLVPVENRTNLDIVAEAFVKKILIEDEKAVGVEVLIKGVPHKIKAMKEVIVSAGAINTPQLLILSGIGPMSQLLKFDIPLVADLPVGLNLQDHPISFVFYKVDKSVPRFQDEIRDKKNIQEYIDKRTGPLATPDGFQLMSFLSNYGRNDIPDFSLVFVDSEKEVPLKLGLRPDVIAKLIPLAGESMITCASQLLHPWSVGSVTLRSKNPHDKPIIDPNYFYDFRDVNDVVQGMKTCHRIMRNPAMDKINARPVDNVVPGCDKFKSDEDLYFRCTVRTIVITSNHPVGTAKMGDPLDPTTVVDPLLRVKGVAGLRVVDASVMPTIPWGNTNIPTIMVAEKASDIIKSSIKCNNDPSVDGNNKNSPNKKL